MTKNPICAHSVYGVVFIEGISKLKLENRIS